MEIKIKAGKQYSICSCGLSNSLPFCDNAHRDFNKLNNTNYKSIKLIPDKDVTIQVDSSNWNLEENINDTI